MPSPARYRQIWAGRQSLTSRPIRSLHPSPSSRSSGDWLKLTNPTMRLVILQSQRRCSPSHVGGGGGSTKRYTAGGSDFSGLDTSASASARLVSVVGAESQ